MAMRKNRTKSKGQPEAFDLHLTPGTYFTDGSDLFRCISIDRSLHVDAIVLFEDCRTLETFLLPLTELSANVHVVRQSQRIEAAPELASIPRMATCNHS
jgi:hypothetical protein